MSDFIETDSGFCVDGDYADTFAEIGIAGMDGVFIFCGGENLVKPELAKFRERIMFDAGDETFFLKRYKGIPKFKQIKSWLEHKSRKAMMAFDMGPVGELAKAGIATPKIVAYGCEFAGGFEKRSFIITQKIPNAQSLEKRLPGFVCRGDDFDGQKKKKFIKSLANFARRFHNTGFRHRDFYLCHIFCDDSCDLTLIDLNRVFRPVVMSGRYRVKDIAQLYYSSPGSVFSKADRLRFYRVYAGVKKLGVADKIFIKKIKAKAKKMASHDVKHNRAVPFKNS